MKRLLLVIGFLSLSGCSSSSMYIDPALAERTAPMRVSRSAVAWKKWVSFGPYRANVTSGVPWNWSVGVLHGDLDIGWQSHTMVVSDGTGSVETVCRTRKVSFERGGWKIDPAFGQKPLVRCAIKGEEESQPWLMTLRRIGIDDYAGSLSRGAESIDIAAEHRVEGGALPKTEPVGYTFMREGATIAAVAGGWRVWIDPALEEPQRIRAAAAAAALLLFDPAEDEEEGLRR